MDVWFHSYGQIIEIVDDLIEIGVNVLNLNQPDIFGIDTLREKFGSRVCFNCPVDHQTVAIKGNKQDIYNYIKQLSTLGTENGGFIGNIEEYSSIGMSGENYQNIVDAFLLLREGKL